MSFRPYDPDFARRLDEIADVCYACREAARKVTIDTQWHPVTGSPAANDMQALADREPEGPQGLIRGVLYIYVMTAAEDLGGLGALYRMLEVMYPTGPLLRAVAEHCARALWVLQRGDELVDDRLARAFLETLLSAEEAKKTAGRLEGKNSDLYRQETERFKGLRVKAEEVFGGSILDEHGRATIRGQQLLGLEDCVAWMYRFISQPLSEAAAKGVYDLLSNLSHPTMYPHLQMWEQPDRPLTLDDHERRVAAAVVPFYNALSMVLSYYGWPADHLDTLTATLDRLMPGTIASNNRQATA